MPKAMKFPGSKCVDCGIDISDRYSGTDRCVDCADTRRKERGKKAAREWQRRKARERKKTKLEAEA